MRSIRKHADHYLFGAVKTSFLQIVISLFTVLFICLPLFFSISSNSGLSVKMIISSTSDPRFIGGYLFVNIAISSIWLPFFLFSNDKLDIERRVDFEFVHRILVTISLGYLLVIALYSSYLYGISITHPTIAKEDSVRVARLVAFTILIHLYIDVLIAVKKRGLRSGPAHRGPPDLGVADDGESRVAHSEARAPIGDAGRV